MVPLLFLLVLAQGHGQARLIFPDELDMIKGSMSKSTPAPFPNPISQSAPAQAGGIPEAPVQPNFGPAYDSPPASAFAGPSSTTSENPLRAWAEHVNNVISNGIEKFGLEIEKEIARTEGPGATKKNIIFSPISLAITMAMVLLGSSGTTFQEVAGLLGLQTGIDISTRSEIVHQIFGIQLQQVHDKIFGVQGPRVDFASAMFVQEDYPIRPEFATVSRNVYQSEVINVDFQRNGQNAANVVNRWVSDKTNGKIQSILQGPPDALTTLILASALYFNGEWNQHFSNRGTRRRPFFIEPDKSVVVDLMFNGGRFPYYEDKQLGAKIVGLPYKGREIWMYAILPNAEGATALRSFTDRLTPDIIEGLIGNMKNETCIITMPRMKISSSLSLTRTLQNLGLRSLFSRGADLSLISSGPNQSRPSTPVVAGTTQPIAMNLNNGVSIGSRIGDAGAPATDGRRKGLVSYKDSRTGLYVEQWFNGFSIGKAPIRRRRSADNESATVKPNGTSYRLEEAREETEGETKVVNLEEGRYRFEEKRRRRRRQTRPIDQDFLNYVQSLECPLYGIDTLRNSGTLRNPGLFASEVLHKVEMDITEKGTEAAAATTLILERDGSQKRILLNRPFLFFIRHNPTKLMLFWGTLNLPTPYYTEL